MQSVSKIVYESVSPASYANRNEEQFGDGCFVLYNEDGQRGVVRLDGKTIVAT